MYRILIVVLIASPARITGSTEPGSAQGLDHRIGSLERIMDQIIGSDHGSDHRIGSWIGSSDRIMDRILAKKT